jgi:hypothetical protein
MSAQIPLDLLTDEQIAIMLASPAEWSKVCILIENKEKELIPFNPNAMQVQMSAVYETMQALGRPTRIIVLKPRQSGGSTFSTIMTIHHAKRYRARGVFMADDLGNSRNLYAMAERHCQTDALPWGVEYTTARGEIHFSNGSLLEQDTANNPKAGISATRQIAHMCLDGKTEVICPDGFIKQIMEIKVGDMVVTGTGTIAMVSAWSSQGQKSVLEVKAVGMPALRCTKEHKIQTKDGWKKAGDISKGDFVALPVRQITKNYESIILPTVVRSDYRCTRKSKASGSQLPLTHEIGFVFGYYLAEGHISQCEIKGIKYPRSLVFTRHRNEKAYTDRVAIALQDFTTSHYTAQRKNCLTDHVEFYGSSLVRLFLSHCGRTCNKHVPGIFWEYGRDFCLGVLLGYLSGDGSKYPKSYENLRQQVTISATTISDSIAFQMRDLSLSLGFGMPSLYRKKGGNLWGRNCKPAWIILWSGKPAVELRKLLGFSWRDPKKVYKPKYQIEENICWSPVLSVKPDGIADVFDIEVDHPDHSYRTASFNVSNSEVCKYPNDGVRDSYTTITNMMASLNKEGKNSLAILESTPDTPAGYFYDQWQKAVTLDEFMAGNEGNGWVKVFTPWHEFESHRTEITEGQRADILATLNEMERDGVRKYGWTPEQIAWRRMTLQTDCGGDERMFSVHYPADELTCWLSAGSPRFDMDGVNAIEQVGASQMVPQYGWLTGEDSTMVWSARAENEAGLVIYEQPLDGHRYLLTIDPATGARNTRGADPDCHGFRVLRAGYRDELGRAHPIKVVMAAKHPCRWDIDVLAKVAIRVCKYYGGCLIVPERNMGLALIEYLRNAGVPLYQDEVIDHLTSKTKSIIGWETNRENRVRCIERLATLIRESSLDAPKILLDPWTIEELKTFVRDTKGHAAAAPGKHDDNVMAVAIGVTCMESATTLLPLVRKSRKPIDYNRWKHVK